MRRSRPRSRAERPGPGDLEVDLVVLGGDSPGVEWAFGDACPVGAEPVAVAERVRTLGTGRDLLLLDAGLPLPGAALLQRLLDGPADAWHAGLALGLAGQPELLDNVDPLSMFSAALDPTIEATSWRVTLRALLVRREVLDQLGGPDPAMETLSGAGLELGYRWIRAGALVRHVPDLAAAAEQADAVDGTDRVERIFEDPPSLADSIRMVAAHRGRMWAGWAVQRAVVTRVIAPGQLTEAARTIRATAPATDTHYRAPSRPPGATDRSVTVVLPTVDRYPYLVPLLGQLASQTVAPQQVVIVDQTPLDRRRHDLADVEPDLPVEVVEIPVPGQSTARNAALDRATGEMLLFIDDDDEIAPTLIADHLERLVDGVDASCGGVDDATAGPPPPGFRHRRASTVFPTNNTMLRRAALAGSGLFDPVFDRGARADRDLGVRLHCSGAVLVYDPSVMVFHHHAPVGGLRTHGARRTTRASARSSLLDRNLPSPTELYLGLRHYTASQRREMGAIRVLSTLSGGGSRGRRVLRAAVQLVLLPDTVVRIRANQRRAADYLATRPPIPGFRDSRDAVR